MNPDILQVKTFFEDRISSLDSINDPLLRLNIVVQAADQAVLAITDFLRGNILSAPQDEVNLFKTIEPEILSSSIFEGLRYSLLTNKPLGTTENQLIYYEDELKVLQSYYRLNPFYYQYYRSKFTELDSIFFMRNAGPLTVPITDMGANPVANFIPPMTCLFAKFLAYEKFQLFILEQIAGLQSPSVTKVNANITANDLKWTGDSINIVELAYGLWLTGQLNNGNASLNQIVRWLETNLHVSLGIVQRRFDEIGRRKRLSPTKYIDHMKDSIQKKIDGDNAK